MSRREKNGERKRATPLRVNSQCKIIWKKFFKLLDKFPKIWYNKDTEKKENKK